MVPVLRDKLKARYACASFGYCYKVWTDIGSHVHKLDVGQLHSARPYFQVAPLYFQGQFLPAPHNVMQRPKCPYYFLKTLKCT